MRSENNFIQGFYFDKNERLLYESAGLYGDSHIQKLVPSKKSIKSLFTVQEKTSETPVIEKLPSDTIPA